MFNVQDIIVYLWMLPVLGFIVLPLLWALFGTLYRVAEHTRLGDIRGFIVLNNLGEEGTGEVEHRTRPRVRLEGGKACIDEDCDCCKAYVSNISNSGICLRNIPSSMYLETSPVRVVLKTRQKDYTVLARPRWKRLAGKGFVIGAEIERIPDGWKELVNGFSQPLAAKPI